MGKKYEFLYMIYVGIVVMATAFGGGWLINNLQLMMFGENQVILLIKNHAFKIIGCLYLLVLFSVLSVLLYKKSREFVMCFIRGNKDSSKKAKAIWVSVFISINILLLYIMVMDVSVVKEDYIYNYSILKPMRERYSYKNIVEIDTGIIQKSFSKHQKWDFYYTVKLDDGREIDLCDYSMFRGRMVAGESLKKIDSKLVDMNVHKISSFENIEILYDEDVDEKYVDIIEEILGNQRAVEVSGNQRVLDIKKIDMDKVKVNTESVKIEGDGLTILMALTNDNDEDVAFGSIDIKIFENDLKFIKKESISYKDGGTLGKTVPAKETVYEKVFIKVPDFKEGIYEIDDFKVLYAYRVVY